MFCQGQQGGQPVLAKYGEALIPQTNIMTVPVVHYESDYLPNPNPEGKTLFKDFWNVRQTILETSRQFGTTGPEDGTSVQYWIVEGQFNDDLYQNMEVNEHAAWTTEWLTAMVECLQKCDGWAISIGNIDQGHLLLHADRIMVSGPTFGGCQDLEAVAGAARLAAERFEERKNGALLRQLKYIKTLLPRAMKEVDANTYAFLATFDGYQLSEGNAVWMLQTKTPDEMKLDTYWAAVHDTAVTADGTIHPDYCKDFWPYTDVEPPYWLLAYIVEDRTQSTFELQDENGDSVGTMKIDPMITDEELKQRLQSND